MGFSGEDCSILNCPNKCSVNNFLLKFIIYFIREMEIVLQLVVIVIAVSQVWIAL